MAATYVVIGPAPLELAEIEPRTYEIRTRETYE
jgi:hypothetical protein